MMEVELEPRVKPLGYKVKATSRESPPSQKAAQILELDLRSHWSTGTNTKEWILLELDEPCLLSHVRIYNKSVLEWEIAVGLRFKPETFTRVRPRCEAPRREMMYHMNYTPCRFVRISCLRGNPIAIFFIQLIGVPVIGLEPEFQPVISHLLPQIVAHRHDIHDMHLQLLQDMAKKLVVFLPQLEVDLAGFTDDAEANLHFLAMLSGPLYPILYLVNERETSRSLSIMSDSDVSKSPQPSALTVSSNFEPWRSRSTPPFLAATGSTAFRVDAVFMLLRKAYRDTDLGVVCKTASRMLRRLIEPVAGQQTNISTTSETSSEDETAKPVSMNRFSIADYSSLFGEEFCIPDDEWDSSYFSILDVRAVEEGILHVLYACASQAMLCHKLAENSSEFWSALPLVQALLTVLRPSGNNLDHLDESFSAWRQPSVQQALSQIVMTTSSSVYRPLLHSTAGYLSSFSQSHVKAACVLIDLCSSVLAPWMTHVIAKVDLVVELLEDLLGIIQSASRSLSHARAALKYILLALSGHMDDFLGKYKEVKLSILFLLEMLEPFLDPAIMNFKSTIAFGDVSFKFPEKEHNCDIALNVIRTAIRKPAVLPSLEYEWRSGSVAPRVLLSILEPRMQFPPEIDLRKSPTCDMIQDVPSSAFSFPSAGHGGFSLKSRGEEETDGKIDMSNAVVKMENFEDASSFFAPPEVRNISLTVGPSIQEESRLDAKLVGVSTEQNHGSEKSLVDHFQTTLALDDGFGAEFFNLQADYFQLANFRECELRASEFQRLASDLHSKHEISVERHDAAVDALLLAAECYINPFFMTSSRATWKAPSNMDMSRIKVDESDDVLVSKKVLSNLSNSETMSHLEKKRDKVVLQLLLEAAQLDRNYWEKLSGGELGPYYSGLSDEVIKLSPAEIKYTDAITLVRQNQALLCEFLIRQLQKEQHMMHEVLMQSLLFLLESATTLSCDPGNVIDIILRSAECLNEVIMPFHLSKEWNAQLDPEKIHQVQRHWILLQKLIIASSGSEHYSELKFSPSSGFHASCLIPFSAWIQRISTFSVSAVPLVRFLGWMAVSRYARQYMKGQGFLASELSQLTCLLAIFADDLSTVCKFVNRKDHDANIGDSHVSQESTTTKGHAGGVQSAFQSFKAIYPDLCRLFPNMKKQFESFGETILEAVALQLRSLPSAVLPDILCWFSESCLSPFCRKDSSISQFCPNSLKGHVGKNAKAIILYILEAIVVEHMEAIVHEIPRLVHVLVSLCRAAYCDVLFLDSVMQLLNPIISYSMQKFSDEALRADDSCLNFESLCFGDLFNEIAEESGVSAHSSGKLCRRPLIIFVLASLLLDLSLQRRKDALQSLLMWANFTASESTASFHDYLYAFQCMLNSCKLLLSQTLSKSGAIPLQLPETIASGTTLTYDGSSKSDKWFLTDVLCGELPTKVAENDGANSLALGKKINTLSMGEIKEFTERLEHLIEKLYLTVEHCWMLHHQLTKKLVISAAECFIYSRCLSSLMENSHHGEYEVGADPKAFMSIDQLLEHWQIGIQGLGEILLVILQSSCWVVASLMLDCLLAVPNGFPLNAIIGNICSAIMRFSLSAPKISWRLQTDKWLNIFFARGFYRFHEIEAPIVELFSAMLTHHEPEQRLVALKHLGKLVGQDTDGDAVIVFSRTCNKLISPTTISAIPESILSVLISSTWDYVTLMASSDTSFLLRTRAMALLLDYIPFAKRDQLQTFLACSDTIVHGLGKFSHPSLDGPLFQLSLALIAGACLYSSEEDIPLIPENIWVNIETLGSTNNESRMGDVEWKTCQVLCRLRNKPDGEKEALREALSSSTIKQSDPDFGSTREAILQVLANLTSAQSYVDVFSGEMEHFTDQEVEMELEVIQNEYASQPVRDLKESHQIPSSAGPPKDERRIKEIKDQIVSIEKSRLREEIVARRQKKLLTRRTRQKFLEEAALREAELLQELDRERVAEVEKEIERQRLLEIEHAKTRELRLNLDLERERQAQRELQREIEQIESGRSSRREIPSSSQTSRSRDRYRERESARSSTEVSGRATEPPALARSYSVQPPIILQSRERADEYGSGHDENLDGSKDSGDANSVGDPELMSAFEGQPAQRHSGSRGSKSRQARERERESRREGKWERKHP